MPTPAVAGDPPKPKQPFFVIGDLHGRLDLLEDMLERIDAKIGLAQITAPKLVFVGDIIDRGPHSAAVLRRIFELTTDFPQNVVCLLGNHEQMMLDFLDAPVARQARWLRNGGLETCRSFGLEVPEDSGSGSDADLLAKALAEALGPDLLEWLQALPVRVSSNNLHVVHAAIDPGRPLNQQTARVQIWGHPEFLSYARADGIWVAHGHTVFDAPRFGQGRISVDTGAWLTGRLTAAFISPDGTVEFLTSDYGEPEDQA